jgi:hypothetical protein
MEIRPAMKLSTALVACLTSLALCFQPGIVHGDEICGGRGQKVIVSGPFHHGASDTFRIKNANANETAYRDDLMNPWRGKIVAVHEQGKKDLVAFEINTTNGECLVFPTAAGHAYSVVQGGL